MNRIQDAWSRLIVLAGVALMTLDLATEAHRIKAWSAVNNRAFRMTLSRHVPRWCRSPIEFVGRVALCRRVALAQRRARRRAIDAVSATRARIEAQRTPRQVAVLQAIHRPGAGLRWPDAKITAVMPFEDGTDRS